MGDVFVVEESVLSGEVFVSSAKNTVLPLMAASLLCHGETVLEPVPALKDVEVMCDLLRCFGAAVEKDGNKLTIRADNITACDKTEELIRRLRASVLVMGPLLSRVGEASMTMPGGCAIGARPVDLHLKGFAALGAETQLEGGRLQAKAAKLVGNAIYLDFPSVGATENVLMAAVLAEGKTVISNAATEPEITDLARFLNACGARIRGIGSDLLRVEGVQRLQGVAHTPLPDRIEAGTLLIAGAATRGDVRVRSLAPQHLVPVVAKLREAGVRVDTGRDWIRVRPGGALYALDVRTMPYPGFPTDLQAQMMALCATLSGHCVITETVFENRFRHAAELCKMGADIRIRDRNAVVVGAPLTGAMVEATDLRGGAALVIAGLCAKGRTVVSEVTYIDRGYEHLEDKLASIGGRIRRETRDEDGRGSAPQGSCASCVPG